MNPTATNPIALLNEHQVIEALKHRRQAIPQKYFACYSSWLGGIITDMSFMLIPLDDHMVHRGDGVFEAMKFLNTKVYLMDAHLQRLELSAARIGLSLPMQVSEIREIIKQTVLCSKQDRGLVRLFVSRGAGGFSTNPYEPKKSELFVVITELMPPSEQKFQEGVSVSKSHVPSKLGLLAQVKSCNYLPNVLMKKEALDAGVDFTVGFDDQGRLTECSTENMVVLDKEGILGHPPFENILRGTTMIRAMSLAKEYGLCSVQTRHYREADLTEARELMLIGTTLDVLPVTKFNGQSVGDGKVGPVAKRLRELIVQDQK